MYKSAIGLMCGFLLLGLAGAGFAADFDPNNDPDLLGYWPFEEGTGTVTADLSGNGNDGTLLGGTLWTEGPWGGAVEFDGVDDYIDTGNAEDLAKWTICCWVKSPAAPAGTSPTGPVHREQNYQFNWNHSDTTFRAATAINVGGTWYAAKYEPLEADTWYHLAATYDGETLSGYRDGELITANSTPSGDPSPESNTLKFGRHAAAAQFFRGTVDEVRVYRRALTADEIRIIAPPKPPQLKAQKPDPADGALDVAVPLLRWTKGETALLHSVYLGTTPELTEADLKAARQPLTLYYHAPGLAPGMTYYWRVDEIEADGATIHTGDVWRFVTQDVNAYYPNPVDGSNTVPVAPTLTWMPALGAVQHQVYLSSDRDAAVQGTAEADKGVLDLADALFAPEPLDSLTTYYWRVDETVAGGAVRTGPVWSFTTVLPVDDFESYTDDEGSRIYETWIDGFTNGNSGSTVGYFNAPFAEQTIVHGGLQSMPMDYNNVEEPFFSEAEQEFLTAQDWTVSGADTLMLYVRGRLRNPEAPLYVGLEDASGQSAAVVHADPAAVTATQWLEWKIPLSEFAGVNAARVKKIYLGVGDRANPQAGGAGRIYVDDIQVTRPASEQ